MPIYLAGRIGVNLQILIHEENSNKNYATTTNGGQYNYNPLNLLIFECFESKEQKSAVERPPGISRKSVAIHHP